MADTVYRAGSVLLARVRIQLIAGSYIRFLWIGCVGIQAIAVLI